MVGKVDNTAAVGFGRGGADGNLERGQGGAGIAAGHGDQRGFGLVIKAAVEVAQPVFGIGEGAVDEFSYLILGQGVESIDAGAGKEGRDDLKGGILRGCADEGNGAVLNVGENDVLLGLVEPVNFIDEEDGALACETPAAARLPKDAAEVGNTGFNGADRLKVGLGHVGDDAGKGCFAGAGRAPQNDGRELVCLNGASEDVAFANDVLLPNEFIEGCGPHAGGKGRLTG